MNNAYQTIGSGMAQNMQAVSNSSLDRLPQKRKSEMGNYPPNINNYTVSHH